MTKSQELEALRSFAQSLGADSYVGPWILENLPSIEADMRSDFVPLASWKAQRDAELASRNEAKAILAEARISANNLINEAQRKANHILGNAGSSLRDALRALER